ncbi:hypothetical protein DMN91_004716 [Ooceraea biroi]|uniref:Uncharacterized protein n=1 Tax=Ooceraea biroi TaxID=2015173 RepID=A0A3L8DRL7_OOCBI|nr:hypothetical protein DMN91_004716 [Ooceraea biroi]
MQKGWRRAIGGRVSAGRNPGMRRWRTEGHTLKMGLKRECEQPSPLRDANVIKSCGRKKSSARCTRNAVSEQLASFSHCFFHSSSASANAAAVKRERGEKKTAQREQEDMTGVKSWR